MHNTGDCIRNMMFGLDTLVRLDDKRVVSAINLDNAATTPPFKKVVEEIECQLRFMEEHADAELTGVE